MNKGDVNEDDVALFRQAIGTVRPVRQNSVISRPVKPPPRPTQHVADERQTLLDMAQGLSDPEILETGDELYFKRDGVQSRLFQKLKRGQVRVESELDLHGMTIAVTKEALCHFLTKAQSVNWRCIRIIHGKGKGSKEGIPVLKGRLDHWLRQRDEVLAFCSARPVDGGTGAVYILLKKRKV
ncbi:MAG: DNA-nicking Smr family endonuclease [Planctomycetota bacterium]|jgi:DNA-nicking Smr family endonuclease